MHEDELRSLLRHMEWADALTWGAVSKVEPAGKDPRLRERLHHIHTVQWVYLQVWEGEPFVVRELESFPDVPAVAAWARPYYPRLRSFAERLRGEDLSRPVEFPWAAEVAKRYGSAGPATLAESVLQVVLHSTYHRGQIATRVRELGGEPPTSDFIAWVWMNRPDPAWEKPSPG
jgi:uncharacterized damage-inducible protein DinB